LHVINNGIVNLDKGDFTIHWWEYRPVETNYVASFMMAPAGIPNPKAILAFETFYGHYKHTKVKIGSNGTSWNLLHLDNNSTNHQNWHFFSWNQWHHLAITRKDGVFYVFKNGELIGDTTETTEYQTASFSESAIYESLENLKLGYGWGTAYQGYMDEFIIIQGKALWIDDFSVPTAPLSQQLDLCYKESNDDISKVTVTSDVLLPSSKTEIVFGDLYFNDNFSEDTLTNQNTWYKISRFVSKDRSPKVTSSTVNDNMTIEEKGIYQLTANLSVQKTSGGSEYEIAFHIDDILLAKSKIIKNMTTTSVSDLVTLNAIQFLGQDQVIDVRIRCTDSASSVILVENANFNIMRIG
jgi:hypothetical protein